MGNQRLIPGGVYVEENNTNDYFIPGSFYINQGFSSGSVSSIKTVVGLAIASLKTCNGLATASIKTINGLSNV